MEPESMSIAVHAHSGAPQVDACSDVAGRCWLCAATCSRGMDVKRWIKSGFTAGSRARCPSSQIACEACVWICSRTSPVPGRPPKPGKSSGGNFRNYSHVAEVGDGGVMYENATKAEHDVISRFLRRPKSGRWWAAIAESGQKHTIPWAPMNGPGLGGTVVFDDVLVAIPGDSERWTLLDAIESLLAVGVPRAAVVSGRWSFVLVRKHGPMLRSFDVAWGHERGGQWFAMCCHLAMNRSKK